MPQVGEAAPKKKPQKENPVKKTYQFIDADQDVAGAELISDKDQGPVIWLQTTASGCYIPVGRLAEFIDGLNATAEAAHDAAV